MAYFCFQRIVNFVTLAYADANECDSQTDSLSPSHLATTSSSYQNKETTSKLGTTIMSSSALRKRLLSTTFVSEPDPFMFGNGRNPTPPPPSWSPLSANWLRSRFHFSFAEWTRGPSNFGVLRVMNDDLVQPHRMFGAHPHRDMEIATYIVHGSLTHWHVDNSARSGDDGTRETLGRGSVQFMTAGTGVTHSEGNDSDVPLRFIQMWIVPRQRGLKPTYGSFDACGKEALRKHTWQHLVGDIQDTASSPHVRVNQDCNIYVAEVQQGQTLPFRLNAGRQAYILNIEGDTNVTATESLRLEPYESAMATDDMEMIFQSLSVTPSHILIAEMAKS